MGSFPDEGVTDSLEEELNEAADMFGFDVGEIVRYGKQDLCSLRHALIVAECTRQTLLFSSPHRWLSRRRGCCD